MIGGRLSLGCRASWPAVFTDRDTVSLANGLKVTKLPVEEYCKVPTHASARAMPGTSTEPDGQSVLG
jgi:hypothetical protein